MKKIIFWLLLVVGFFPIIAYTLGLLLHLWDHADKPDALRSYKKWDHQRMYTTDKKNFSTKRKDL